MVSLNSIHVRFASGCIGYLYSQRGDGTMGLGGWWSVEVGGTRGTFIIENCVEKFTYIPAPGSPDAAGADTQGLGKAPPPQVHNTGVTDFGAVAGRLRERVEAAGGEVRTGAAVVAARQPRDRVRARPRGL